MELIDIIIKTAATATAIGVICRGFYELALKPLELASIKTDLVNFISDIEQGITKTDIQILNAHEQFTRYDKLGGNSYVHSHWENLKKEGRI